MPKWAQDGALFKNKLVGKFLTIKNPEPDQEQILRNPKELHQVSAQLFRKWPLLFEL
jgi:hypothetical protein